MRCAHCKTGGVTIDHVRNCAMGETPEARAQETSANRDWDKAADQGPMWPASDKQAQYVLGLQDERQLPEGYTLRTMETIMLMEKDAVSADINFLKTLPRKGGGSTTTRKQYVMPAGRYAIQHSETGVWWFFEVNKPTEGRWFGYTFIKRLIGAPGQYNKVALTASERAGWLDAIERDPKQAMVDYGLQSGVCGRCSSPLTDPDSLARGLGPVCAGKSGWFS